MTHSIPTEIVKPSFGMPGRPIAPKPLNLACRRLGIDSLLAACQFPRRRGDDNPATFQRTTGEHRLFRLRVPNGSWTRTNRAKMLSAR